MRGRTSLNALALTLALVVASACGGDRLSGLVPVLAAKDGQTVDSTKRAQYLVDFGEVAIGDDSIQTFFVEDKGRATLTLEVPKIQPPFGARQFETPQAVLPQQEGTVELVFAPTAEGPAEEIVTLESDGGELTLRLVGSGRAPQPTDCSFDVAPTSLDFGSMSLGQTKTLSFQISNTSANPCDVSRLTLTGSTSDAFSIVGGAVASATIAPSDHLTVQVAFAPMLLAPAYSGAVQFGIGPPDTGRQVTLKGNVPSPCPGALPDGSCPAAPDPIYVNDATTLYTWNASTNRATRIGNFGGDFDGLFSEMTDIAIDNRGVMMGVDSNSALYVINPSNARCTEVGAIPDYAAGLTFLPDGSLIASGQPGVWSLDENSGGLVRTVPGGSAYSTSGDIIGLPDGKLYWAVTTSGNDNLMRLDPTTGQTSVVTSFNQSEVYGLAYEDGLLYGFTGGGKVVTINPIAGAVTQTRPLSGSWYGATTNPATWTQ